MVKIYTPTPYQKSLAKMVIEEIGPRYYDPDDLDEGLQNDQAWMIFDDLCIDIYEKDGGELHDENPPMPKDEKMFEGCVLTARHIIASMRIKWTRADYLKAIADSSVQPSGYKSMTLPDLIIALEEVKRIESQEPKPM